MGRHNKKERTSYKKKRRNLAKEKNKNYSRRDISKEPLEKVHQWLDQIDSEKDGLVKSQCSETYSEKEEIIINDSLYKSYVEFCRFLAFRKRVNISLNSC